MGSRSHKNAAAKAVSSKITAADHPVVIWFNYAVKWGMVIYPYPACV
jgi:hypothetical protein